MTSVQSAPKTWKRAFPNGSSWYDWLSLNCEQCVKAAADIMERDTANCDLEQMIWDEGMEHSAWSPETWRRVGPPGEWGYAPSRCAEFEALP